MASSIGLACTVVFLDMQPSHLNIPEKYRSHLKCFPSLVAFDNQRFRSNSVTSECCHNGGLLSDLRREQRYGTRCMLALEAGLFTNLVESRDNKQWDGNRISRQVSALSRLPLREPPSKSTPYLRTPQYQWSRRALQIGSLILASPVRRGSDQLSQGSNYPPNKTKRLLRTGIHPQIGGVLAPCCPLYF